MAKKEKEPKQEIVPLPCCGLDPVEIKYKSRYMFSCADHMRCACRGEWKRSREDAIVSYNNAVRQAEYAEVLKNER